MANGCTREWIQFFTGCGIPDDVAAMYALIFYENRIQKNMLLDLNKEYLRDMGITVMGDVIAILRHAKTIHEKYLRAQILSVEDNIIVEKSNPISESSPAVKKTTPIKRMLEHFTRKHNSSNIEPPSQVQVILPNDIVAVFSNKAGEKNQTQKPFKKKIQISNIDKDLKEKGLEVPVPKVRRVLPENEGGYKIKMPSGTTEKSKKLLEKAMKQKAKTVFDRLGESSVSSTTSETSTISSTLSTSSNRKKNSSVFSRLGEKTSVVSSTSSLDDSDSISPDLLPYAGILKQGAHKKGFPNSTMRADEQEAKTKKLKTISVMKRLGMTKPGESPSDKKTTPKAVKRKYGDALSATIITTNNVNAGQKNAESKMSTIISTNFKADSTQPKPTTTITSQIRKTKLLNLKRKMNDDSDGSPLKKVRFGRTTHRLIPASSTPAEPANYVKNYPKLTMYINNRESAAGSNNTLPSGIKVGTLNSDSLNETLGVKARIGNKYSKKKSGIVPARQMQTQGRKMSTVKDRLG